MAYLRALRLIYHHRLPSPAPLLASQMICLWPTYNLLYYLWFAYDHLWITYITYALLIIYLSSTYDILRLLMMTLPKKNSFSSYADNISASSGQSPPTSSMQARRWDACHHRNHQRLGHTANLKTMSNILARWAKRFSSYVSNAVLAKYSKCMISNLNHDV